MIHLFLTLSFVLTSMEIKFKQGLSDFIVCSVSCLSIDKLGEMYMRDVAMETAGSRLR